MALYDTPNCGSHAPSALPSRTSSVICNGPVWSVVAFSCPNHGPTGPTLYPSSSTWPVSLCLVPWLLRRLPFHLCTTTWFLEEPLSLKPRTSGHHEVTEAHTIGTALAVKEKNTKNLNGKMIKKSLETVLGGTASSLNFISCSVNLPLNRTPSFQGGSCKRFLAGVLRSPSIFTVLRTCFLWKFENLINLKRVYAHKRLQSISADVNNKTDEKMGSERPQTSDV